MGRSGFWRIFGEYLGDYVGRPRFCEYLENSLENMLGGQVFGEGSDLSQLATAAHAGRALQLNIFLLPT